MYREFITKNPVSVSITLFVIIFFMVQVKKPGFLFKSDGSIRQFGIGYKNKTIFPMWLFAIFLGIICYLFVLYYIETQ
jgi:hypothetical protein